MFTRLLLIALLAITPTSNALACQRPVNATAEVPREFAEYKLDHLKIFADRGNVDGMYLLGVALLTGHYGEQDLQQGQYWLAEALKKDDLRAMRYVAHLHLHGTPPYAKDHKAAFGYLSRASANGDPVTPRETAYFMKQGLFMEEVPEGRESYMKLMLHLSAGRGDVIAMHELAECLRTSLGGEADEAAAHEWAAKAEQARGDAPAVETVVCPSQP